jgi:hypothetical protein
MIRVLSKVLRFASAHKKADAILWVVIIAFVGTLILIEPKAATVNCQNALIPAYFSPDDAVTWGLATKTRTNGTIMIANASNGPGTTRNSTYADTINRAKASGVKVYGYVHTSYAASASDNALVDARAWNDLYGVKDIFVDEVSTSTAKLNYYQTIAQFAEANGGTIILNPGTFPPEEYMSIGGIVVVFEGTMADYQNVQIPSWFSKYPASRYANLIYGVSSGSDMDRVIALGRTRGMGFLYATDDTLPNPWDTLPSYWSSEVTQLKQGCTATTLGKPGDLNNDGHVTAVDLSIILAAFGQSGTGLPADANKDGLVDVQDLSIVLNNYGT